MPGPGLNLVHHKDHGKCFSLLMSLIFWNRAKSTNFRMACELGIDFILLMIKNIKRKLIYYGSQKL